MLILLPPSETKRPGGSGRAFDPASLALPALLPVRERVIDALVELSRDEDAAARVLKLSDRQRGEIAHNAALRTAPGMPAVDRYTGVLYDALDAGTLDPHARRWLGVNVLIHSAPFGPVRALDRIPPYRLSANASLPALPPLRRLWADGVRDALAHETPSFVLDLRSEAYVALGPVPEGTSSAYVRVVTASEDGTERALNHFNKHAKGALVRALAESRPRIGSVTALVRWADDHGWAMRTDPSGELLLVV